MASVLGWKLSQAAESHTQGAVLAVLQLYTAQRRHRVPRVLLDPPWPCAFMAPGQLCGNGQTEGRGEGRAQGGARGKEHRRAERDWGPRPPHFCAHRSPPGRSMALAGVEVGSSWKEAASTSSSSRSVRLYTSSRSVSSGLKSLVSTPGRGTRIPPRSGCASCCQWWSVTEPGGRIQACRGAQLGTQDLSGTPGAARRPLAFLTFQRLHDLQLVRQEAERAQREARGSGVLRAPRASGAGGHNAAVGRRDPAGAVLIPQPPQLALPLRIEEGALLRVAPLLRRQPLHRRLQILAAGSCPRARRPAGARDQRLSALRGALHGVKGPQPLP